MCHQPRLQKLAQPQTRVRRVSRKMSQDPRENQDRKMSEDRRQGQDRKMSQDEENAVKKFLENPDLVEKLLPYLDVFTVILVAESPVPATSLPFGCLASRGSWGSPWFFVLVAVLLHEKEKENKSGFHKMRLDWLSLTKIYWFGIIHLTF